LPSASAKFSEYAQAAGLNVTAFQTCLTSAGPKAVVRAQQAAGLKLGVQGTPTVYLNGVQLRNYSDENELAAVRAVTAASPGAV
ncbi:DsbA family protein, partial [Mycobacterium kansasii]